MKKIKTVFLILLTVCLLPLTAMAFSIVVDATSNDQNAEFEMEFDGEGLSVASIIEEARKHLNDAGESVVVRTNDMERANNDTLSYRELNGLATEGVSVDVTFD